MEAGEEKGGWETGFYFLIFTNIVKMGDSKIRKYRYIAVGRLAVLRTAKYCGTPEGREIWFYRFFSSAILIQEPARREKAQR